MHTLFRARIALSIAVCALMGLGSSGCGRSKHTLFTGNPAVPLFTMNAQEHCANPGGRSPYPDNLQVDSGESGYGWAEGGGCVNRPIKDVWGVLLNQSVMKFNGITKISWKKGPPPPKTSYFFEVHYVVSDILTVRWTMQWYHTVGLGTKDDPEILWVNYKRVAGDPNVDYWEGTIILQKISPTVTAVILRDQIHRDLDPRDPNDSLENSAKGTVGDIFEKMKSAEPVPLP